MSIREYEKDGYGSMVVLPEGIADPEVLFCGHLDVIEHPELEQYESWLKDGRIYGPGAGDMKGAVAIMLELFRNLHRAHRGFRWAWRLRRTRNGEASTGCVISWKKKVCGAGTPSFRMEVPSTT